MKVLFRFIALVLLAVPLVMAADRPDAAHQIAPEDLAHQLQSGDAKTLLIFNVGPRTLYDQAHLPGAEYMGAASSDEGLDKLRDRVKALAKKTPIILYCGCCPWDHCPNVGPAFTELQQMGFTNVKVMYVVHNIGADWVDKGYPVERRK
jgi:rhodanese-related sulfurtransferase